MIRRPDRLTDADIARVLAHMPDPPPPSADLTDRIVASAIAAGAVRPRGARRRFGRIWWAIAILGAAGAVTAAAANAGRFEFARVLELPQEIARAAGWAPHHRRGPLLLRAVAPTPGAGQRRLAPLAVDRGERAAPIVTSRPHRFAGGDRIERQMRFVVRSRPDARFAGEHRRARGLVVARTDRAKDHAGLAAPPARLAPAARPTPAPHDDFGRVANNDALRFHDADAYAQRQALADRGWRVRDDQARRAWAAAAADRPWAVDRGENRRAANGDQRWATPGWRRRADNRPFHPFRPHPPRGRRG